MSRIKNDILLRCSCGKLAGQVTDVSPTKGNRCVCYCNDCQAFAHFLGRADEILDAHGGTDIFQIAPRFVQIESGGEHLACVRLTDKGIYRWYARCCNTPIGNTVPGLPFVGLVHNCLLQDPANQATEALTGPVTAGVYDKYAKGDRDTLPKYDKSPAALLFRQIPWLLMGKLRGHHKPSPFFNDANQPSATPKVLTADELRKVEASRDA